jgi:hypothetical protein
MLRSILAVAAGFVVIAVTGNLAILLVFRLVDPVTRMQHSSGFLLLEVAYGFIFSALGGYVAAIQAQRHPIAHASLLGGVMLLLSLLAWWSITPRSENSLLPSWYLPLSMAGRTGFVVIGGYLGAAQIRKRSSRIPAI